MVHWTENRSDTAAVEECLLCRKIFEVNDWSWYPSECSLETFDARKLSQKLQNRSVLVIGDSLMAQVMPPWRSFACLLCNCVCFAGPLYPSTHS